MSALTVLVAKELQTRASGQRSAIAAQITVGAVRKLNIACPKKAVRMTLEFVSTIILHLP